MNIKNVIKASLIVMLLPMVFASCKKDFVCNCKSTDAFGNESTQTYPLENQTRADAVENCENFESDGVFATRNCNL